MLAVDPSPLPLLPPRTMPAWKPATASLEPVTPSCGSCPAGSSACPSNPSAAAAISSPPIAAEAAEAAEASATVTTSPSPSLIPTLSFCLLLLFLLLPPSPLAPAFCCTASAWMAGTSGWAAMGCTCALLGESSDPEEDRPSDPTSADGRGSSTAGSTWEQPPALAGSGSAPCCAATPLLPAVSAAGEIGREQGMECDG